MLCIEIKNHQKNNLNHIPIHPIVFEDKVKWLNHMSNSAQLILMR
jgi:hypothetical protein